jgi:hypothetical protein
MNYELEKEFVNKIYYGSSMNIIRSQGTKAEVPV